jgi:beta-N-acetylhexosaminidase
MAMMVTSSATTGGAATSATNLACATHIVATWPLRQIANETITVPVSANQIGNMGPAARAGYGGLILFGTTARASLPSVLATLQRERPGHFTMMVMTDEEGGGVLRLTNFVSYFPWAQTMGHTESPAQITVTGRRVGRQLVAAGLNTDLAPVADVDGRAIYPGEADPDGLRSFSGVVSVAATDVTAFMRGLQSAGVTSVIKHFPGLGHATRNTDYGPASTLPWSTLERAGLIPFKQAIASGASAVMLSNASVPGLTTLPAGLSPSVVNVLRTTLGFQGLIVTDSLGAGAISALHLSESAASVRALKAGADLVLYGSTRNAAASLAEASLVSNAIVGAVRAGTLPSSTLIAAAAQVLAARNQLSCPVATTTVPSTTSPSTTTAMTTAIP